MATQQELLDEQNAGFGDALGAYNDYSFAPVGASAPAPVYGSPSSWESTASGLAGLFVKGAIDAKYYRPERLEALRIQALGENGYYTEGQSQVPIRAAGGIPISLLLIGGFVLFLANAK